jgi:lysophospholipase L1-like esterase
MLSRAARTSWLALALAACGALGAAAPEARAAGTYVALGDSVAAPPDSYVHLLFGALRTEAGGGLDTLRNHAAGGENSGSLRTSGQLARAIADIDGPSDTRVVTIDIGGNDRTLCGGSPATWHLASCPFAANFDASLADLQAALGRDPGSESLVAMTYYNPASGTGTTQEQQTDIGLLGSDLTIFCFPAGDPRLGLNDRIACISATRGALVADVYPAFKAGGQSLMLDGLHPNAQGQLAIAREFSEVLGVPAPTSPDLFAPVLRELAVRPREFRAARRGGSIAPATASGAKVSYRLSEAAVTKFGVMRSVAGTRLREGCVVPRRRRGRPCTRWVRMRGSFTHDGRQGVNRFSFTGRAGGKRLQPGRYRLVARSKDAAGNLSNRVRAPFRIRR